MERSIKSAARDWVTEEMKKINPPQLSGDSDRYEIVLQNKNYFIQITSVHPEFCEGFDFIVTTPQGMLLTITPLEKPPGHASIEKAMFLSWILDELKGYLSDIDKHVFKENIAYLTRLAVSEKIDLELLILEQQHEKAK